jgi:Ca2+ transporting ATPase
MSPDQLVTLVEQYLNRTFSEEVEALNKEGLETYESLLKTSFENGLSNKDDFEARANHFGSNKKPEPEIESFWAICWETMKDKINVVLQILGVVSLVVGAVGDHPEYGWVEGFAILLVVSIIVLVSGSVGYSKQKKFKELQEIHKNRAQISIVRSGKQILVHPEEVLVGDKVFLDTGAIIPADGIVLNSNSLLTNESALTGENDLMHKDDLKTCTKSLKSYKKMMKKNTLLKEDKHIISSPIVISGTSVAQGTGYIIAIAVGKFSKEGRISDLAEQEGENTPLEEKLDDVAEKVSLIGLGAGLLALIALFLRFFIRLGMKTYDWDGNSSVNELISYFLLSFTVVAVAIPEGLPCAVTICLAYSVKQMQKDNNLVKTLAACETMGGADMICSDKTGTLTKNKMELKRFAAFTSKNEIHLYDDDNFKSLFQRANQYFQVLKEGVSLCTSARVERKDNGDIVDVGAQTELAIIKMIRALCSDPDEYLTLRAAGSKIVKINPFSSERKKSSIIIKNGESYRVYVIGAPDFIEKFCVEQLDLEMKEHPFTTANKEKFLNTQSEMARLGLRTLSIAYRDFDDHELINSVDNNNHPILESQKLTILALFGIQDPPRDGVREAVEKSKKAGIKVRMVTGDNPVTAEAIAREVGITNDSEAVIDGSLFNFLVGGVMCEKCEDKQPLKDPRLKEKDNIQVSDIKVNECNCPRKGKDCRNDVIVNFEEFKEVIKKIDVIARCAPEHKYTAVTGLKQMGHVVAVTGDGTNDAPALRKANVGFAMGIAGTEYARQAADIILIDDNFGSIIKAAVWGRGIYDNIQRFIQFQLTINVVAVVCSIVGAITIQQSCLTAVQMLWVNMIMDSLAALALATEKPTEEVLNRPPQNPSEFIVTPLMFKHIFGHASIQIALLFAFMFTGENMFPEFEDDEDKVCQNPDKEGYVCSGRLYDFEAGYDYKDKMDDMGPSRHFTYIFNTFIWFQLFSEFNSRRIKDEVWVFEGLSKAPMFVVIWFITIVVQILIVQFGYRAMNVNRYGLTVEQWFICIAYGTIPLLWRFLLLIIPGFKGSIKEPEHSGSHMVGSVKGSSKRHFSSSYRIV